MKYIKFYADWCQPCEQMSRLIEENFKDIDVMEINIEDVNNQNLVEEYKIMSIPALFKVETKEKFDKNISVENLKEFFNIN